MELATQIYNALTSDESILATPRSITASLPELLDNRKREHWLQVLRMAALCHDIGHLPFSHAAEEQLLPQGKTHESLTWDLIHSEELSPIWDDLFVKPDEVAKIAVGPEKSPCILSPWETILSEIIVGDIFGADRMDYLLRDAHHTGVAYGKFDYRRLISTIRLLPKAPEGEDVAAFSKEPSLGVEIGGLQAAESLLWARYLMFSQVYFHHVRLIYDYHLQQFMAAYFGDQGYPIDNEFLDISDNEILTSLSLAAKDSSRIGHHSARRLLFRDHFRKVYHKTASDFEINPFAAETLGKALAAEFGLDNVHYHDYSKPTVVGDFPVLMWDGTITSGPQHSQALRHMPSISTGYIFVEQSQLESAQGWIERNKHSVLDT